MHDIVLSADLAESSCTATEIILCLIEMYFLGLYQRLYSKDKTSHLDKN